jgi:hypothetical protein
MHEDSFLINVKNNEKFFRIVVVELGVTFSLWQLMEGV